MRSSSSTPKNSAIDPMLTVDAVAKLLAISRRTAERMRSSGKLPQPDLRIGRLPRWKPETIRAWIEKGGAS
jgi:excisionase family DNA binding protein